MNVDAAFSRANLVLSAALILVVGYGLVAIIAAPPVRAHGANELPFAVLSILFVATLAASFFVIHLGFKRGWKLRWLLQFVPLAILAYGFFRSGNL